jgi:membrane-associated protease RseP (regulator of RpoE activity)
LTPARGGRPLFGAKLVAFMDHLSGNGHSRAPVEVLDLGYPQIIELPPPRVMRNRKPWWPALVLFLVTLVTTLAVGSEFALSYAHNVAPFSGDDNPFAAIVAPLAHPHLLVLGIPFSFALLGFLMAHEMGHYVACQIYGIDVSYPYFIPSPFLFGTFGAFLRIRSPIATRRALFDVGIAGPIAGFVVAVPLMAYAISISKIVPGVQQNADIIFGQPMLMKIFMGMFHPGADPTSLLLHPIGQAAWVGLFATALNLLPCWQLDGGHILYTLASKKHKEISLMVALGLIAMGIRWWHGWGVWGIVLLVLSLRFRHPPVYDRWEPLDAGRKLLAVLALAVFVLCFTQWPTNNP